MDRHVESFLRYLRSERGLAENTVLAYSFDLEQFLTAIATPLLEVKRDDIRTFLATQLQDGRDARSVSRRLSAVRHFYRFLMNEDLIFNDPTAGIPVPRTWKTAPKYLSGAEIQTMANAISPVTALGLRDRAMVLTCFGSGLRVSELVSLNIADLDLDHSFLTVRQGKGAKDRIAPLNPVATSALRAYMAVGREQICPNPVSDHVFISHAGTPLTRQLVFSKFRALAETTLGKTISPHWLRHSFATALIEGGADLRAVQAMMGHASIDTTQVYLDVDLRMLRESYYATHPRARRKYAA